MIPMHVAGDKKLVSKHDSNELEPPSLHAEEHGPFSRTIPPSFIFKTIVLRD